MRPATGGRMCAAGAALAALALLAGGSGTSSASPFIDVHVSVKLIRDPANGLRPQTDDENASLRVEDDQVQLMVLIANTRLNTDYWRGYRFVLDEIIEVGGTCTSCPDTHPSYWYGVTFADGTTPTLLDFETRARQDVGAFAWRDNAINVYFNKGKGDGAVASFPPDHAVMAGGRLFDPSYESYFPAATFAHELGHYFSLAHPNARLVDCCNPASCILDGDGIGDTPPDGPCFTRDQLSTFNFGAPYASLPPDQQARIDDIWTNNMSYLHPGQGYGVTLMDRLTEGQLDRWTDTANGTRAAVRSGRTWFISTVGSVSGSGSSGNPFRHASQGLNAAGAGGGDILLFQPGTYSVSAPIGQPVTLRASRRGPIVLTTP